MSVSLELCVLAHVCVMNDVSCHERLEGHSTMWLNEECDRRLWESRGH